MGRKVKSSGGEVRFPPRNGLGIANGTTSIPKSLYTWATLDLLITVLAPVQLLSTRVSLRTYLLSWENSIAIIRNRRRVKGLLGVFTRYTSLIPLTVFLEEVRRFSNRILS